MEVKVPCGRCIGCRLEYSRQWAIRCVHEAQMHDANAFITLTYAPEYLPADYSVDKGAIQKFFKRLRKSIDVQIRYFACGEYGEQKNRPHYHAIIFGYDFPDKQLWAVQNGHQLYRSKILEKAWPYGHSSIGEVTFESAAYVARYVMKKHKPDKRKIEEDIDLKHSIIDPRTGEIHQLAPEFCLMSRGNAKSGTGGIGKTWLEKYKTDTDKDFITVNGKKMGLPKYYDSLLAKQDEENMLKRKQHRIKEAKKKAEDNTYDRLHVREKVKESQLRILPRNLEKVTK